MGRRISRREFLVFAGALTGAGAALGSAALLRGPRPETVGPVARNVPVVPGSTTPAPAPMLSSGPPPEGPVAPAALAGSTITALCRDAWGARPVSGSLVSHTIERLTVHHTATRLDHNRDAPSRARGHQRYHQDAGWPDLAYHFLIDANGHVYEGRPVTARGDTFTSYDPTGHFLVCCEGNFDQQDVPAAQFDALTAVLAWAGGEFGVGPDTIAGHRDYAATTCPGDRLAAAVTDGTLRAGVERLMGSGGVTMRTLCGEDGPAVVAGIEAGTDDAFVPAPSGFFLRYEHSPGPADAVIPFGESDWLPSRAGDTSP